MHYTHEEIKLAVGTTFRAVRVDKGYKTQKAFANHLNNNRTTITEIENPKNNAKFSTLEKYSNGLNISQKDLMIMIEDKLVINNKPCPPEISGTIFDKLSQLINLSGKKYFTIASNTQLLEDTIQSIKLQRRIPSVTTFILIVNELGYQPSSLFED